MRVEEAIHLLFKAKTEVDVDEVLVGLNDRVEWIPLGGRENNIGIVNMGAEPKDGITERITNSIDAMIELEVELNPELLQCSNPREAVEKIYGFKDGYIRSTERRALGELASNIKVKFQDSGLKKRPTIEIWDKGIGQHPSDFPDTLVSLNQTYKITKFYLMGAFGQGGQTSFSYCKYGIIISRKSPKLLSKGKKDEMGFTIVRYHDPTTKDDFRKIGHYQYCIDKETSKVFSVSPSSLRVPFDNGTLIRLVSYQMPKGTSDALQPASVAWSFLSQSLFDPLLPIRLYEERKKYYKSKSQSLTGVAYRLWKGGKGVKAGLDVSDTYDLDLGMKGKVRINYWALSPKDEFANWKEIRRGFVSPSNAVFITFNGQRHGVENPRFLRDKVGLTYSNEHIIVQIDCDQLENTSKKELFSSTRERLIEGEFKDDLMNHIVQHLKDDRNIRAFEKKRKENFMNVQSHKDTSRIRNIVGRYIAQNKELLELLKDKRKDKIEGEVQEQEKGEQDEIREDELEIPDLLDTPTYIKITNTKDPIPIEKGGNSLIRLETNAKNGYFEDEWEQRFRIIHEKGITKKRSCSNLRNGKISYYIWCPSSVRVGSKENMVFELDLPDGGILRTEGTVLCIHPYERKIKPKKVRLKEPTIITISQQTHPVQWGQFGWDKKSVGRVITEAGQESGIWISIDNKHIRSTLENKRIKQGMHEIIEERYVSGVAFYLFLRKVDELKKIIDPSQEGEESVDGCPELDRMAQTIAILSVPLDAI
jgi:hypothetical protein